VSYNTSWLIENHIVLTTLSETLTINDIQNNDRDILTYVQGADTPRLVHLIIDVSTLDGFPTNIVQIKQSANSYLSLPTMGWLAVVGVDNPIIRFLSTIVTQMTNVNLIQVESVDQGLERLLHLDPTIQAPS